MLGKAPTRMVLVVPCAHPQTAVASQSNNPTKERLLTLVTSDDHGEDAGRIFLLILLIFLALGVLAGSPVMSDQIRESRVVEDAGGRVTDIEKHLIERAVGKVAVDQVAQLFSVTEGGEWAVNQADDLAQIDVRGIAAQLVAALGAAHTFHHAGVLELEEDQFEKLLRERLLVGDVADLDGSLVIVTGEHHHGLEGVESFLRDLHRRLLL